jgi:PAS domain S-box-containing protein
MNITESEKDPPLILVVDDDKFMRIQLRKAMEQAGYQVAEANDGEEALAAYTSLHPDIVLLDAMMPVMDGFTCCHLLQEHTLGAGAKTPVLMITALDDRESVDRAFEAGAIDYITKPIHWAVLRQRVRRILQESRANKERQRSEQKIREQAALLDIATDAIIVQDLENKILFWNQGADRLYGWNKESAIGKNIQQLLYKKSCSQLKAAQETLTQQDEWQGELHQVTKAGQEIIVESRWTRVRDAEGKPKSILVVNTNITQKKLLEAQFLRAQRLESIGTLASGIAHDLNNVLAPILMSVQLLQNKLPDEQSQRLLSTLERNTKRAAELVKQVLSFARGIEGKRTILQIAHLIGEIEQIAKQTFPKLIQIRTDIPTLDLWPLSGDATQLHQVLMNVCVNARDAMPYGGTLKISAENLSIDSNYARMNLDAKVGPYVVITITDTGTGISPEILDRIYEPFFTTKEVGKGTGLGLSTVIGIVKSHGGFVSVSSFVGEGTQFKIYLPAAQTVQRQQVQEHCSEPSGGHGELILVVDDEASICEVTKTSLETYSYKVITASDGIEAVALYAQHKDEISAVLLDMMMPSMDGATTIRTLQKMNPQVKIIAASGLVSHDKVADISHSSVKSFLQKPYTTAQLVKTLHGVLNAT